MLGLYSNAKFCHIRKSVVKWVHCCYCGVTRKALLVQELQVHVMFHIYFLELICKPACV